MKLYKSILLLSLLASNYLIAATAQPLSQFLDRRYNQVTQIKTHNSTSTTQKSLLWFIPNLVADQHKCLEQQLIDGIRVFKIPVHPVNQANVIIPWVTHTLQDREIEQFVAQGIAYIPSLLRPLFSGAFQRFVNDALQNNLWKIDFTNLPVQTMLTTLKTFLDSHPNEIITLFLNVFDLKQMHQELQNVFHFTGIDSYMVDQAIDQEWPTIGQLIAANKRLIVFADERINAPGFNYGNDFIYSNDYNYTSVDALNADAGAGALTNQAWQRKVAHEQNPTDPKNPDNTLFGLNHFVTPGLAGTPATAQIANSYDSLMGHVNRCAATLTLNGKKIYPTFLEVKFYDLNFEDQLKVAARLNG